MALAPFVNTSCYLIVNEDGKIRSTRYPPSLGVDEVAIKIELTLPQALFTRPRFEARVKVSEDAVRTQPITPEVLIQTKELIEQQTGLKIDLRAVAPESGQ